MKPHYGYVVCQDSRDQNTIISLPNEDLDWVADGFSKLPTYLFKSVWTVDKDEVTDTATIMCWKGEDGIK